MEAELLRVKTEKNRLKEELLHEHRENTRLNDKIVELNIELQKKSKDIENLQLHNSQLVMKCKALQDSMEEQSGGWGWSLGLWKSSTTTKLEELAHQKEVLEEELNHKIEECATVNTTNYNLKRKYKQQKKDLLEQITHNEEQIKKYANQLEAISIQQEVHRKHIKQLNDENLQLRNAVQEKAHQLTQIKNEHEQQQNDLASKTQGLEWKLKQKVSLDDRGFEHLARFNAMPFNQLINSKQQESCAKAIKASQTLFTEAFDFLTAYCQRLGFLFENSSSHYLFIISQIQNYIDSISAPTFLQDTTSTSLLAALQAITRGCQRFLPLLKLQLQGEPEWTDASDNLLSANKDILESMSTLTVDSKRLYSLAYASAFSKHNAWESIQLLTKRIVAQMAECSKAWGKRLALDTGLNYSSAVKSARTVNDKLIQHLDTIYDQASLVYSFILQIKSNFYYHASPMYVQAVNFMAILRSSKNTPGIPYKKALEMLEELHTARSTIEERDAEIKEANKQLTHAEEDCKLAKSEIVRLENEVAAMEQNWGDKGNTEPSSNLFTEPETLSEDVKNGAQRIAIRLTDALGNGVPVSSLATDTDVIRRFADLALDKLNSVALRVNEYYTLDS